jgi:hypothetical protein
LSPRILAASQGSPPSSNAGALAASTWLRTRGIRPPLGQRWHVEIALDVIKAPAQHEYDEKVASRFHLDIYAEEWGVFFCHRGQASWIRVTDIAFVHGRDDFKLLGAVPPLRDVGMLLRKLEGSHQLQFQRQHAAISSNIPSIEPAIRTWVASL